MDSIPKFMASVITIIIGVVLCISFIISAVVVNSARTFHSSVIDQIEASDFEESSIEKCIKKAENSKYALKIEKTSTPESVSTSLYKVTLNYGLYAPIFGKVHKGELVGYALAGARVGDNLNKGHNAGPIPGLYEEGALALYYEGKYEEFAEKLITPWSELIADGIVSVTDGSLSTQVSYDGGYPSNNVSAAALKGELFLPDDGSIVSLVEDGFFGCQDLAGIRLPDSLKTIEDSVFNGCNALRRVDIGSGLESVGDWAFNYGYVTTVTYNGDINDWCKISFTANQSNPLNTAGCADLYFKGQLVESIVIPKDVTSIKNLFARCGSIKSVFIPDGSQLKEIDDHAFYWCYKQVGEDEYDGLTSIYIGEGVEKIHENAFLAADVLEHIYLPSTLNQIAIYTDKADGTVDNTTAFDGCWALDYIVVNKNNTTYYTINNNVLVNKERKAVEFIPYTVETLDLSEYKDIEMIAAQAAFDRQSLKKVILPESIKYINRAAFSRCKSLTTIEFRGTMADWNNIVFGSVWNNSVPATKVICSDGTIWF